MLDDNNNFFNSEIWVTHNNNHFAIVHGFSRLGYEWQKEDFYKNEKMIPLQKPISIHSP